jgi:hypothetical protein
MPMTGIYLANLIDKQEEILIFSREELYNEIEKSIQPDSKKRTLQRIRNWKWTRKL